MSVSKHGQTGRLCRLAAPHRVRALVVDDVEDNREVLSGLLERAGVEVTMASSGAVALQLIAQQIPDIIFMDVRMPVMDGLTAVRQLRERWPAEGVSGLYVKPKPALNRSIHHCRPGYGLCLT